MHFYIAGVPEESYGFFVILHIRITVEYVANDISGNLKDNITIFENAYQKKFDNV